MIPSDEAQQWIPEWLPLIQTLSKMFSGFSIFKNSDSALLGKGDIDAVAPVENWNAIAVEFRRWACSQGLESVVECRHFHNVLFLVALDRKNQTFWELDLLSNSHFRGSVLFHAEDLVAHSVMDPRGYRRIRPGAEGLLLLLHNGMRWGGSKQEDWMNKGTIQYLLSQDPDGVELLARQLQLPSQPTQDAVLAVVQGSWNRKALVAIEWWAIKRAIQAPRTFLKRPIHRMRKKNCPLLNQIFHLNRRINQSPDEWLITMEKSKFHTVTHCSHI